MRYARDQGPGTKDQGPRTKDDGYDHPVSPLAAVIFDFDGILIDSETPEYESHRQIFERCGATLTTDEWCDQIGLFTDGHEERWFRELCARSASPPDRDAYHAEKRRLFDAVVPAAPMRGVAELLA